MINVLFYCGEKYPGNISKIVCVDERQTIGEFLKNNDSLHGNRISNTKFAEHSIVCAKDTIDNPDIIFIDEHSMDLTFADLNIDEMSEIEVNCNGENRKVKCVLKHTESIDIRLFDLTVLEDPSLKDCPDLPCLESYCVPCGCTVREFLEKYRVSYEGRKIIVNEKECSNIDDKLCHKNIDEGIHYDYRIVVKPIVNTWRINYE